MCTAPRRVDRGVAIIIVGSAFAWASLVALATYGVAWLEFTASVVGHERELDAPPGVLFYRAIYAYSLFFLALPVLWGAWILRTKTCSVRAVALYVGIVINVALFWLLLTAMALYCENQRFYV